MSLFHRHKYKQVEQVCAWYEVMVEFDLDELGIDRKKIRKMFLDNGWLVIRYKNGTFDKFEPKVTIEFNFPMDITFIDKDGDKVWDL